MNPGPPPAMSSLSSHLLCATRLRSGCPSDHFCYTGRIFVSKRPSGSCMLSQLCRMPPNTCIITYTGTANSALCYATAGKTILASDISIVLIVRSLTGCRTVIQATIFAQLVEALQGIHKSCPTCYIWISLYIDF